MRLPTWRGYLPVLENHVLAGAVFQAYKSESYWAIGSPRTERQTGPIYSRVSSGFREGIYWRHRQRRKKHGSGLIRFGLLRG